MKKINIWLSKLLCPGVLLFILCGINLVQAADTILAVSSTPDRWDIIITGISVEYDNSGTYVSVWSGEATIDICTADPGNIAGNIGGNIDLQNHGNVITAVKMNYYTPCLFKGTIEYSGTIYYTPNVTDDDPMHVTNASTTPPAGVYNRLDMKHEGEITWTNLNIVVSQNTVLTLQIKPKFDLYKTSPTASPCFNTSPWVSETAPFAGDNYNFKLNDTYWPNRGK